MVEPSKTSWVAILLPRKQPVINFDLVAQEVHDAMDNRFFFDAWVAKTTAVNFISEELRCCIFCGLQAKAPELFSIKDHPVPQLL